MIKIIGFSLESIVLAACSMLTLTDEDEQTHDAAFKLFFGGKLSLRTKSSILSQFAQFA